MDYHEEFCEILKAYMGAEKIVSVDAEPLSRGVKALRQFTYKVLWEEARQIAYDHAASRVPEVREQVPGNPVLASAAMGAAQRIQIAIERRAKEIQNWEAK